MTKTTSHRTTWTIPLATFLGIGAFALYLATLYFATRVSSRVDLIVGWSGYQRLMLSTLLALLATCVILGPIAVLIAHKRESGSWWDSIEWNPNRTIYWSILAGMVLAVANRVVLRVVFGSAGSFREYPLALSMGLYVVSDVFVQPAVEEMYFRGILFLALAERFGGLAAIAVVTVIFALMHPAGYRLNVLPAAIALGLVRLKTRSLASCFALHASYNLFLVLYQLAVPS